MEPILSKLDEINCTRNIFEETEVKAIKLDMWGALIFSPVWKAQLTADFSSDLSLV